MRKKVKAVYFSDSKDDEKILEWVEGKGNFSRYVRGLIESDMREELDPRLKAALETLVETKLRGITASGESGLEVSDELLKGIF